MATDTEMINFMRGFELDHQPDGWPCVQMKQISDLCEIAERLQLKNEEMLVVLKDIYRITGMNSRASHKEQTEIFHRMRKIIGIEI